MPPDVRIQLKLPRIHLLSGGNLTSRVVDLLISHPARKIFLNFICVFRRMSELLFLSGNYELFWPGAETK
jgi:hypothetical protein